MNYIDSHCHLDGEEFKDDRDVVVQRSREAGCQAIFLPAIDVASCHTVLDTCRQYPGYCYPMLGLHPEEVRADWRDQLAAIRSFLISLTEVKATSSITHSSFLDLKVKAPKGRILISNEVKLSP